MANASPSPTAPEENEAGRGRAVMVCRDSFSFVFQIPTHSSQLTQQFLLLRRCERARGKDVQIWLGTHPTLTGK